MDVDFTDIDLATAKFDTSLRQAIRIDDYLRNCAIAKMEKNGNDWADLLRCIYMELTNYYVSNPLLNKEIEDKFNAIAKEQKSMGQGPRSKNKRLTEELYELCWNTEKLLRIALKKEGIIDVKTTYDDQI